MAESSRAQPTDKICDMCADVGFPEEIATCCKCNKASEHIYCMEELLYEVPDTWTCEVCLLREQAQHEMGLDGRRENNPFNGSSSRVLGVGKKERAPVSGFPPGKNASKVKFIPDEETTLLKSGVRVPGRQENSSRACRRIDQTNVYPLHVLQKEYSNISISATQSGAFSQKQEAGPSTCYAYSNDLSGKESFVELYKGNSTNACNRVVELISSTRRISSQTECGFNPLPLHNDDKGKREMTSSEQEVARLPTNYAFMSQHPLAVRVPDKELRSLNSETTRDIPTHGSENEEYGFLKMDKQLTLLINPEEKHLNAPAPNLCWWGAFEVFDVVFHIYDEIQVHFPFKVSHKTYEMLRRMPGKLELKLLSRAHAWPHIFQLEPPNNFDIGLYFFPSKQDRLKEKYTRLMERMDLNDFAMKCYVDDVELLIYTSKQLPKDCQRIAAETFLWGVFRHVKLKKPSQPTGEPFPSISTAAPTSNNSYGQVNSHFQENTREDMDINMEGGTEIGKVDRPVPTPGFSKKSLVEITSMENREVEDMILDHVPRFSRPLSSQHEGSSSSNITPSISIKERRGFASSSIGQSSEALGSNARERQSKPLQESAGSKEKTSNLQVIKVFYRDNTLDALRTGPCLPLSEIKKELDASDNHVPENKRKLPVTGIKPHTMRSNRPSLALNDALQELQCVYFSEIKKELENGDHMEPRHITMNIPYASVKKERICAEESWSLARPKAIPQRPMLKRVKQERDLCN